MSYNPTGDETFGPESFLSGVTLTTFHVDEMGMIHTVNLDAVALAPVLLAALLDQAFPITFDEEFHGGHYGHSADCAGECGV